MPTTNQGAKTHFAPPEREPVEAIRQLAGEIQKEPMLAWLEAVPMTLAVVNQHRQILFCNERFRQLSMTQKRDDVLGLRPGEALSCVHSDLEEAGCGCSFFCDQCGAARAIVKSLEGEADCQECRMVRRIDEREVPLDLQVFTQPVDYRGHRLTLFFALDIGHELRLRYLNRAFYHGLINGVGGIASLTELIEAQPEDTQLFPLLIDSARRTLTEVAYHRDLFAAENGRLSPTPETFPARPCLEKLIRIECEHRNTQPSLVELDVDEDVVLHTDKRLLGHILRNLLANALEAGMGRKGAIRLTCSAEAGQVVLALENPGEIPETIRKDLFKRYVSSKSRNRGLGTYVIKLLTEQYLGGSVTFRSGNGSTRFEISLPAASAPEAP